MKKIFLVTTEASGDLLGARLVGELKQLVPDLLVEGVGGDLLAAQGMHLLHHVREFNLMGLFEVLSQLKRLRGLFRGLVEHVSAARPDLVILIDAPDFNLRFAKAIRPLGLKTAYYVSPQVWAWRKGRAKAMAPLLDHMMVLFDFEVPIFEALGLPTTWTGHPLVDEPVTSESREAFCAEFGLNPHLPLVALAPGSRKSEVGRLLPVMAAVAAARAERYQFAIPLARTIDEAEVRALLGPQQIPILPAAMRRLMRQADAAIVASGTATLETALLGAPMIVGYKLKTLSYWMARALVKVPHIAIANIVLGKRAVPELVQHEFCVEKILPLLDELAVDSPRRQQVCADYRALAQKLGGSGASRRAAEAVWRLL